MIGGIVCYLIFSFLWAAYAVRHNIEMFGFSCGKVILAAVFNFVFCPIAILFAIVRGDEKEIRHVSLLERKPTQAEINSACMYMDHSFGLMDEERRKTLSFEACEWLNAWHKVNEDALTRFDTKYKNKNEQIYEK
jgi:hypothetical protein